MNNSNNEYNTLSGFVPMKRTKERQPNKQTTTDNPRGKKWQRNDNKRNYENG